jgi:hypothetical protein
MTTDRKEHWEKKDARRGFGRKYKTNLVLLSFVTTPGMCQKEGQKVRSYRETDEEWARKRPALFKKPRRFQAIKFYAASVKL